MAGRSVCKSLKASETNVALELEATPQETENQQQQIRDEAEGDTERNEVDNMPYATWCSSCVAGEVKADWLFMRTTDDGGVGGVAGDCGFMGDTVDFEEVHERCLPALVRIFRGERLRHSTSCSAKKSRTARSEKDS